MAKDPVCWMIVDEKTALNADVEGRRFYFCSSNCLNTFANPEKELSKLKKRMYVAASYIINRLHMMQIACVESEFIVPGVIYAEGKLRHPFRLYSNERGDVCVLVCEAPVMIQVKCLIVLTGATRVGKTTITLMQVAWK